MGPDELDVAYGDELVVATPEMVTFDYQLAGIGSRIMAQVIDFPIQVLLLLVALLGSTALGWLIGNGNLAILIALAAAFVLVWGYYIVSEAVWSGQTVGKKVFGLRVVGDQGEPIRLSQAFIRNLIRIVDFLPGFYGLGLVVLFMNGRGKRLGDMAAGTVVVREKATVRLHQLVAPAQTQDALPARADPVEHQVLRGLDADLRQFVQSYAYRRPWIDPWRRHVLATAAEPALRRALPGIVATQGPQAALDQLADLTVAATPRSSP